MTRLRVKHVDTMFDGDRKKIVTYEGKARGELVANGALVVTRDDGSQLLLAAGQWDWASREDEFTYASSVVE